MTKRGDKAMELDKFLKELEIVNINDPAEDFNSK